MPLLASSSQRTWQQCLVCPLSIYAATAVAQVEKLQKPPCILALKDSISFQGSPTLSSPNCGIASNSTDPDGLGFKGNNGINLNAPSFTAGGCSQTGGHQCDKVTTHAPPVPDPLSGLNSAMSSLKTSDFSSGKCPNGPPTAYGTTPCYNNGNITLSGQLKWHLLLYWRNRQHRVT